MEIKDIGSHFDSGVIPMRFIPNNRYDDHLFYSALGFMYTNPVFGEWRDSMDIEDVPSVRRGDAVPVIHTTYNLSVDEVRALATDPEVFYRFMDSMCKALIAKALPYDEIFSCILDAICSADYVMFNNLHAVH